MFSTRENLETLGSWSMLGCSSTIHDQRCIQRRFRRRNINCSHDPNSEITDAIQEEDCHARSVCDRSLVSAYCFPKRRGDPTFCTFQISANAYAYVAPALYLSYARSQHGGQSLRRTLATTSLSPAFGHGQKWLPGSSLAAFR